MQELVYGLSVSTSQDTVTAELQSPFQSPWPIITRDDSQVSGTILLPLHDVTADLQTPQALLSADIEAVTSASAPRLIQ